MRSKRIAATFVLLGWSLVGFSGCGEEHQSSDGGVDSSDGTNLDGVSDSVPDIEEWPDVPEVPWPEILIDELLEPCGVALRENDLLVAEEGGDRILSVPLLAGPISDFATGLDGPTMIAVSGDNVFVTARKAGDVWWLAADATTKLSSGDLNPGRIRTAGSSVYWVNEGTGAADGAIRWTVAGSGISATLVPRLSLPKSLTLTSSRVYFTEYMRKRLGYVDLDGTGLSFFSDPNGYPFDVVVDEDAGEVFWSSPGIRGGGWIRLGDSDLRIGDQYVSFSPPGPEWLWLGPDRLIWSTAQTLSWAERKGGAYTDIVVETSVCDFTVRDQIIYWSDRTTGRVYRQTFK